MEKTMKFNVIELHEFVATTLMGTALTFHCTGVPSDARGNQLLLACISAKTRLHTHIEFASDKDESVWVRE